MIGPRLEVHDLAHDAFVEIFRSAHRFQGDRSALSGWVRGIAVHVVQRYLRQRGDRQAVALWADPSEEDLVEATDASPSLRASVHRLYQLTATLPADEREALHLRYFAELELTEVAASVGVSLATIKRRLVLARTSLAAAAAHDVILMHWIQEFDHGE